MSAKRTEEVFSATASTYDSARGKLVPCFAEFYAAAIEPLPECTDHVLDLGAGTGLLSAFVRQRFPNAHLHMMDNSAPMLEQAKVRFQHDQESVFELDDYTLAFETDRYDAVVSALSIHHLADASKRDVFRHAFAALKPGGVFINAEQILQSSPELESRAKEDWLLDVRRLGATEKDVSDSLLRQAEDRCATVTDQLHWLREAGFSAVQCTFQQGRFAVLTGTKRLP